MTITIKGEMVLKKTIYFLFALFLTVYLAACGKIEENDLSDKQVYLFCSHGTGGLARSVQDISEVLPESVKVSENVFDVYEDDTASAKEGLLNWLGELQ